MVTSVPPSTSPARVQPVQVWLPLHLHLHWPLRSTPDPDPCALGRATVAPPVQDEPCTGGDARGAHSALCSRRTRNPSFQGPICPGPHVPQSALSLSVCVHVCVRRGSRYSVVSTSSGRIDRTFYPPRYNGPSLPDPGPPTHVRTVALVVYLAHGHGQRKTPKSPIPIQHPHRSSPSSCYNIPERSASLLCSLLHTTAAAAAAPDRQADKTTKYRLRHDLPSRL